MAHSNRIGAYCDRVFNKAMTMMMGGIAYKNDFQVYLVFYAL